MEHLIRFAQVHNMLKKNALQSARKNSQKRATPHWRRGRVEQVESPTAEKLTLEQHVAEQAETLRELTSTNAALSRSARAGFHGDIGLGGAARVRSVSEREQTRRLALLKGINFVRVQTEVVT